jgi:hypothetical protein
MRSNAHFSASLPLRFSGFPTRAARAAGGPENQSMACHFKLDYHTIGEIV